LERREFDGWAQAAGPRLHRVGYLLTGDWGAAEDLVQHALVATWRRFDRLDAPEAFARTVMARGAASRWRRKWHGEVPHGDLPEPPAADPWSGVDTAHELRAALLALPAYRRLTAGGNVANGGATGRGRRHAARWRRYTSRSSWPLPRGGGRGALRLAATQSPAERHLLNPPGPACVTRRARYSQPPSSPRRPTWYWRSPGSQGTPKAQPDWL